MFSMYIDNIKHYFIKSFISNNLINEIILIKSYLGFYFRVIVLALEKLILIYHLRATLILITQLQSEFWVPLIALLVICFLLVSCSILFIIRANLYL